MIQLFVPEFLYGLTARGFAKLYRDSVNREISERNLKFVVYTKGNFSKCRFQDLSKLYFVNHYYDNP